MLDLNRYGIAHKWPKLRQLQEEVADLEKRRAEAERAVVAARQAVEGGREEDAAFSARAVRQGKDVGEPKHELKARAQLQASERTQRAFTKAVEDAQADLARFMAKHSGDIRAAMIDALQQKAHRLAQHAKEAGLLYGALEDAKYDLREFAAPPTPPDENAPAQRLSTTVIGLTTQRAMGPNRGDIEQMLAYLAGLEAQYAEPGADNAA